LLSRWITAVIAAVATEYHGHSLTNTTRHQAFSRHAQPSHTPLRQPPPRQSWPHVTVTAAPLSPTGHVISPRSRHATSHYAVIRAAMLADSRISRCRRHIRHGLDKATQPPAAIDTLAGHA